MFHNPLNESRFTTVTVSFELPERTLVLGKKTHTNMSNSVKRYWNKDYMKLMKGT